jgi:hypothetical protein
MKKIILSILTLGVLGITSCTSDPCKDLSATTKCNSKGVLVTNGSSCDCQCDAGYSGDACNLTLVGQYQSNSEVLGTSTSVTPYTTSVSLSGSTVSITKIKNGFFKNVAIGSLSGNTITLNANQEPDNDGYKLSGTGTISSSGNTISIKWAYSITGKNAAGATVTDNINGTWTK